MLPGELWCALCTSACDWQGTRPPNLVQGGGNGDVCGILLGKRSGWNCHVTPTFSGIPNKGDKINSCYRTPAFSGAQK